MIKKRKLLNKSTVLEVVFLVLAFLLILLVHQPKDLLIGDDYKFQEKHKMYGLVEYLNIRYNTWSSRIVPDAVTYYIFNIPLFVWRLINTCMIFISSYSIIRIIKRDFKVSDIFIPMVLMGYFGERVLHQGYFWITGSINYLWPIAIGLYILITYADSFFREEENISIFKSIVLALITIVVSLSNEQFQVCIVGIAVVYHLAIFILKRKQNKFILLLSTLMVTGLIVMMIAPGNNLRMAVEIKNRFPSFNELSIIEHVKFGNIWMFNGVFTYMRILIIVLSVIVIVPYMKTYKVLTKIDKIISKMFVAMIYISFISIFWGSKYIYRFRNISNYSKIQLNKSFIMDLIPYLYWILFIGMLVYLMIKASDKKILISLCLLATLFSMVVMYFSPTMEESGPRVFLIASLFLNFITTNYILENELFKERGNIIIVAFYPIVAIIEPTIKILF